MFEKELRMYKEDMIIKSLHDIFEKEIQDVVENLEKEELKNIIKEKFAKMVKIGVITGYVDENFAQGFRLLSDMPGATKMHSEEMLQEIQEKIKRWLPEEEK